MARLDDPRRLHPDEHRSLSWLRSSGVVVPDPARSQVASRSGRNLAFRYLPGRVELPEESWRSVISNTIAWLIIAGIVIAMCSTR
jgi:hypothetical protein